VLLPNSLSYNNTNGVFTYTPPDLSSFLTSYTETDTLSSVTARGSTTSQAITISNLLTADSLTINNDSLLDGNVSVSQDLTISGDLYTTSIINNATGVPRWTSGSDFIIDAAGDVNVVGSKITNLGTPTDLTDAATKAYVDSAASAFNGGTVAGAINITDSTASTNKDTGALIVNGGVGVEGNVYAGGLIYVYDTGTSSYTPVLTSASGGYNGGIISGTVFINNSTVSTSATSGALRVTGGVGIAGTLNTGPDAYFNAIRFGRGANSGLGSNTNVAVGGGTGNDTPLAVNTTGLNNIAIGYKTLSGIINSNDNVAIGYSALGQRTSGNSNVGIGTNALLIGASSSNTAIGAGAMANATGDTSTCIGHDALHDSAGSGNIGIGFIAGNALETGDYNVIIGSNTGETIDGTSNNILICDGAGNVRISSDATGTVRIPATANSTSTSTGALVVTGGIGVGDSIYAGGTITVSNTTASTSTTTGSIVTSGGLGVAGNVYATSFYGDGSNLSNVAASSFSGGTVAGATSFTNTTASTSTITGAVRITGGLGVQGAVYAANFNGVIVPTGGTAPGANRFVRTEGNGYTYTGYINATHGTETLTLGSVIVSNSTDSFYRRVTPANFKSYIGVSAINGASSSNYGAVTIQGEKNTWAGISFRDNAGTLCNTLMARSSDGYGGIYNKADNNWLLQWDGSGNFTATANVTAYSDERLKKNVQKIPNALEKVLQLDGVTFERIDNGQRGTGLLAQQLQKVLEEAVMADEKGMLSVAYGNTVGLLVEAIKEQQSQIEQLKNEISLLKGNR
jgi:hypothetical protein